MSGIQVFQCPSCGASVPYSGGTETSVTCQFCGSNVIIPEELRPHPEPEPDVSVPYFPSVEIPTRRTTPPARPVSWVVKALSALLGLGFFVFIVAMVMGFPFRMSGSYRQALEAARTDPAVVGALGAPVEARWLPITGELSCDGNSCSADYNIPIRGSRKRGYISVMSYSRGAGFFKEGRWVLDAAVVIDAGRTIELTASPAPIPTLRGAELGATQEAIAQTTQQAQAAVETQTASENQTATAAAEIENAAKIAQDATATAETRALANSMIATQAAWRTVFSEPFKDNSNKWPGGITQDKFLAVTSVITDGSYLLTVKPKQGNAYTNLIPEEAQPFSDISAAVTVQFNQGDAGDHYAYGLVYRHVNDDYGFFGIENDGAFRVLVVYDTGIYQQIEQSTTAIRTGPGLINRIEVRAIGSRFVFLINDQVVAQLTEDMAQGDTGLGVDVVKRRLNVLLDMGWIEREKHGNYRWKGRVFWKAGRGES